MAAEKLPADIGMAEVGDEDLSSLAIYLRQLSERPNLDAETNFVLGRAVHSGDEVAKVRMIEGNLSLVVKFAKRYRGGGLEFMDLIQAGSQGLMRAVEKYDPYRGYAFSTYASWWIKQSMYEEFNNSGIIRIPPDVRRDAQKTRKLAEELKDELGRAPTDDEIAERAGLTTDRVKKKLGAQVVTISLDEPFGETRTVADTVPAIDESMEQTINRLSFRPVLAALKRVARNSTEIEIIIRRYMQDKPEPYPAIAEALGLSQTQVRAIDNRLVAMLKNQPEVNEAWQTISTS